MSIGSPLLFVRDNACVRIEQAIDREPLTICTHWFVDHACVRE
jgi:hypothetical protein